MQDTPFRVSAGRHPDGRSYLYVVQQDPSVRTDLRNGTMLIELSASTDLQKAEALATDLSAALAGIGLPF